MVPLADALPLSRQSAVLAFQLGDGLVNLISPVSNTLVGCLADPPTPTREGYTFEAGSQPRRGEGRWARTPLSRGTPPCTSAGSRTGARPVLSRSSPLPLTARAAAIPSVTPQRGADDLLCPDLHRRKPRLGRASRQRRARRLVFCQRPHLSCGSRCRPRCQPAHTGYARLRSL